MTAPVSPVPAAHPGVPRLADDYTAAAARRRMAFLAEATGVSPEHLGRYSFDPAVLAGNIENFVGVAQVPIGIAGPLLVDGEHARGIFYVPLATTEGTLVASYYYSITIPALIVATYGGGTGLPTQRECLELLGCYGPAGCASWPRSSPPPCCAARSRWARPSWRTNGSRRTSGSAGTGPSTAHAPGLSADPGQSQHRAACPSQKRQVAHGASPPLQLLLGNIITCGQRCAWVGCGGRCVCCGFWSRPGHETLPLPDPSRPGARRRRRARRGLDDRRAGWPAGPAAMRRRRR